MKSFNDSPIPQQFFMKDIFIVRPVLSATPSPVTEQNQECLVKDEGLAADTRLTISFRKTRIIYRFTKYVLI